MRMAGLQHLQALKQGGFLQGLRTVPAVQRLPARQNRRQSRHRCQGHCCRPELQGSFLRRLSGHKADGLQKLQDLASDRLYNVQCLCGGRVRVRQDRLCRLERKVCQKISDQSILQG